MSTLKFATITYVTFAVSYIAQAEDQCPPAWTTDGECLPASAVFNAIAVSGLNGYAYYPMEGSCPDGYICCVGLIKNGTDNSHCPPSWIIGQAECVETHFFSSNGEDCGDKGYRNFISGYCPQDQICCVDHS